MESPLAELAPVVDRCKPPLRRLVLRPVLIRLEPLDLQYDGHAVGETNQEVRLIGMGDAQVDIRDGEPHLVVPRVERDRIARQLQAEGRGTLPGGRVHDDLIDLAPLCRVALAYGLEVYLRRAAGRLVAVQQWHERRLAGIVIRLDGIDHPPYDPAHIRL